MFVWSSSLLSLDKCRDGDPCAGHTVYKVFCIGYFSYGGVLSIAVRLCKPSTPAVTFYLVFFIVKTTTVFGD